MTKSNAALLDDVTVHAESDASRGLIATIKVKGLLDFSLTNPEFRRELSINAAKAAATRGVELDAYELDLLNRSFVKLNA